MFKLEPALIGILCWFFLVLQNYLLNNFITCKYYRKMFDKFNNEYDLEVRIMKIENNIAVKENLLYK